MPRRGACVPAASTGAVRRSFVSRPLRLLSKYTMSDPTPPSSYTFEVPARSPVYIVAPRPRRPYWLHILLLLITLFTTLTVGARLQYNFLHNLPAFSDDSVVLPLFHLRWLVQHPANLVLGIPLSMTLMGILDR